MQTGKLTHANYELEYFIYGHGPKTLIAFHGFNNNARDFESLGEITGDKYTIVAINIFFHGNSTVRESLIDEGFSNSDLITLFEDIYKIRPSDKYLLMGYSLGGRIAIKFLELIPQKVDKIILLAPDGIKINPFYTFFTRNSFGKKMLKKAVTDPSFFNSTANFLRKTRIISEKRYHFTYTNFENRQKREKVYQVWMTLKNVVTTQSVIRQRLKDHQITMHLFFGKYDKIIPPSIGEKFRKGLENLVSLHVLDEGHRLIKREVLYKVMKLVEKS